MHQGPPRSGQRLKTLASRPICFPRCDAGNAKDDAECFDASLAFVKPVLAYIQAFSAFPPRKLLSSREKTIHPQLTLSDPVIHTRAKSVAKSRTHALL
jgi:hypothetical protein